MRIAVTGGAGFIGSHVVDRLVAAGHDVVVIDLLPPSREDITYTRVDVTDVDALEAAMAGCDAVFHLAGVVDVNEAERDPSRTLELNVVGTSRVWEAARRVGVKRSLLASTVWVYDAAAGNAAAVDETVSFAPDRVRHVYTASKLAAELVAHSARELYGQEFTILRYGIPYGPRMRESLVIPRFVRSVLGGEPITVHGDGNHFRSYVYVEDLADAHVCALRPQAANQTFNLEGSEPISIRQLVTAVSEALDQPVEVRYLDARSGDFAGRVVSGERACDVLGWAPSTPFREGLRRSVSWLVAGGWDVRSAERRNHDDDVAVVAQPPAG